MNSQLPDSNATPDYAGLLRFDGKGVVVLGAGQGIGRQASHAFAQLGANVVLVDREKDLADAVAAEINGDGGSQASTWIGDITQRDQVEKLADEAAARLGRIDNIVDIVGISQYQSLLELNDEQWTWHEDMNIRHAFLALQIFGKKMADQGGGAMTFVASVSGIASAPMHGAYGAFKAGLMSLVRTAAVELGPLGVRTNAVAPGVVWTPRVSVYLGEKGHATNSENAPLHRVALPADIAAALLFLSSDLAGYINGQTLTVDGGVSAKFGYPLPDIAK